MQYRLIIGGAIAQWNSSCFALIAEDTQVWVGQRKRQLSCSKGCRLLLSASNNTDSATFIHVNKNYWYFTVRNCSWHLGVKLTSHNKSNSIYDTFADVVKQEVMLCPEIYIAQF